MDFRTYGEIKDKVNSDLDTEDEIFVTSAEMLQYANEAIRKVESIIHTLYEDYFLTYDTLSLVSGTSEYNAPSDIYANKLRSVYYLNGSTRYRITKGRSPNMFDEIENANYNGQGSNYKYIMLNRTAGAVPKMYFYPTPLETVSNVIKRWYLRSANRMVNDDSVCDIPEFDTYVEKFMKYRVLLKEGNPGAADILAELLEEEKTINATLTTMIPDEDNSIPKDMSHYEDMDSDEYT